MNTPLSIKTKEDVLHEHVKDIYLFNHGTLEKREQLLSAILEAMEAYASQFTSCNESVLREALEEIINPIKFIRLRLKDGEVLNGTYAVLLSKDAHYLQSIAIKTLSTTSKEQP